MLFFYSSNWITFILRPRLVSEIIQVTCDYLSLLVRRVDCSEFANLCRVNYVAFARTGIRVITVLPENYLDKFNQLWGQYANWQTICRRNKQSRGDHLPPRCIKYVSRTSIWLHTKRELRLPLQYSLVVTFMLLAINTISLNICLYYERNTGCICVNS